MKSSVPTSMSLPMPTLSTVKRKPLERKKRIPRSKPKDETDHVNHIVVSVIPNNFNFFPIIYRKIRAWNQILFEHKSQSRSVAPLA